MTNLAERFLSEYDSDLIESLDAACRYIEYLENCVSPGFVRAKPVKNVRPPKVQVAPLGPGVA